MLHHTSQRLKIFWRTAPERFLFRGLLVVLTVFSFYALAQIWFPQPGSEFFAPDFLTQSFFSLLWQSFRIISIAAAILFWYFLYALWTERETGWHIAFMAVIYGLSGNLLTTITSRSLHSPMYLLFLLFFLTALWVNRKSFFGYTSAKRWWRTYGLSYPRMFLGLNMAVGWILFAGYLLVTIGLFSAYTGTTTTPLRDALIPIAVAGTLFSVMTIPVLLIARSLWRGTSRTSVFLALLWQIVVLFISLSGLLGWRKPAPQTDQMQLFLIPVIEGILFVLYLLWYIKFYDHKTSKTPSAKNKTVPSEVPQTNNFLR